MRAVLASVVALTLASCSIVMENAAAGPLAIIRDGDSLRVAVCDSVSIVGARMSERGHVGSWSYFWQFEKAVVLTEGDILTPVDGANLGVEPGRNPAMAPGDDILVVLSQGDTQVAAQFSVRGAGLSEDAWLHPDGTETSEPCASG